MSLCLIDAMMECSLCPEPSHEERVHWATTARSIRSSLVHGDDDDSVLGAVRRRLPVCTPVQFDGRVHRSCAIPIDVLKPASARPRDADGLVSSAESYHEVN